MVTKCPACHSGLSGHRFAEIATAVCDKENVSELATFFECARNRKWVELRRFREFRGDRDDVVASVVACGEDGAVMVLKSVVELYAPDELLMLEIITQDDIRVLKTLIDSDEWQTIIS